MEVFKGNKQSAGICARDTSPLTTEKEYKCKIVGRYVRLIQDGADHLYFKEMVVYGQPLAPTQVVEPGEGEFYRSVALDHTAGLDHAEGLDHATCILLRQVLAYQGA